MGLSTFNNLLILLDVKKLSVRFFPNSADTPFILAEAVMKGMLKPLNQFAEKFARA
jgi:hypothetical protein